MTDLASDASARACEELVYRAARLTDLARWDDLAALFLKDGKLTRPSDRANPVVGRSAILASLVARPSQTTRHVLSNVLVEFSSATTAHISSIVTLYVGAAGSLPTAGRKVLIGHFEDDVTLVNGRWAFGVRDGTMALVYDFTSRTA